MGTQDDHQPRCQVNDTQHRPTWHKTVPDQANTPTIQRPSTPNIRHIDGTTHRIQNDETGTIRDRFIKTSINWTRNRSGQRNALTGMSSMMQNYAWTMRQQHDMMEQSSKTNKLPLSTCTHSWANNTSKTKYKRCPNGTAQRSQCAYQIIPRMLNVQRLAATAHRHLPTHGSHQHILMHHIHATTPWTLPHTVSIDTHYLASALTTATASEIDSRPSVSICNTQWATAATSSVHWHPWTHHGAFAAVRRPPHTMQMVHLDAHCTLMHYTKNCLETIQHLECMLDMHHSFISSPDIPFENSVIEGEYILLHFIHFLHTFGLRGSVVILVIQTQ